MEKREKDKTDQKENKEKKTKKEEKQTRSEKSRIKTSSRKASDDQKKKTNLANQVKFLRSEKMKRITKEVVHSHVEDLDTNLYEAIKT